MKICKIMYYCPTTLHFQIIIVPLNQCSIFTKLINLKYFIIPPKIHHSILITQITFNNIEFKYISQPTLFPVIKQMLI